MKDIKERILTVIDYIWRILCWIIAGIFLFLFIFSKELGLLFVGLIFLAIPFGTRRRNNSNHEIAFLARNKNMSIMRQLMRLVLMLAAVVLLFFSLYHFYKSQTIYGLWCLIIGYGCVKLYVYGRKMNNQQPISQQLKQIRNQVQSYDKKLRSNEVYATENDVYTCINCGMEYQGFYCPICGQDRRLNKTNWTQLFLEGINFDTKFFRTCYGLVRSPGEMLHTYINGHHACYCSPIRFVVLTAIVLTISSYMAYSDIIYNTPSTVFNGDMVLFPCVIAFFVDFIPIYGAFCWTKVGKILRSADFFTIVLYFIGMDFLLRSVFYIIPNCAGCSPYLRTIIMICYQFYVLKEFFHLSLWRACGHYVIRSILYILCTFITLSPIFFSEAVMHVMSEHHTVETTSLPPKSFGETYKRTTKAFTFITGGIVEQLIRDIKEMGRKRRVKEDINHADEEIVPSEKLLVD